MWCSTKTTFNIILYVSHRSQIQFQYEDYTIYLSFSWVTTTWLLRTTTCDTLFVPSAFSSNILGSSDLDTYKFWMFHLFIKCMWNIWAYIFPPCSRQVDSSNCLRVMDDTYEQKALERDGKWGQHLLFNIVYIQVGPTSSL